jgi:hypothetical protein
MRTLKFSSFCPRIEFKDQSTSLEKYAQSAKSFLLFTGTINTIILQQVKILIKILVKDLGLFTGLKMKYAESIFRDQHNSFTPEKRRAIRIIIILNCTFFLSISVSILSANILTALDFFILFQGGRYTAKIKFAVEINL